MTKPRRTESTPGPKPKAQRDKVTHHLGAGVTRDEWQRAKEHAKALGKSQSTIVREAFGL